LVLFLVAQPLIAVTTTYYVGTCRIGAYGSISAAVAAVPPGSIVDVCPGTYSEQVVISQNLTLQGIFDSNSSQVVITVPSAGLTTTSSIYFGTVAAQVQVTAGPVKINNITVDGTAGANCPTVNYYVGIFYSSGSSGNVSEVETRNQTCNSGGLGILAENTAGAAQSVTIGNNNVHDYSYGGITACSDQNPSTLTVAIKGNYVGNTLANDFGIVIPCNAGGTVSGNTIVGGSSGILTFSSSGTLSGNTITGASTGIDLSGTAKASANTIVNAGFAGIDVFQSGTASSNRILNSSQYGILIQSSSGTVKSNTIIKSPIGIEFQCNAIQGSSVSGNTINGAATGTDQVPATFNGVNNFNNVKTVRTGC
jgi:hypothetical protein